MARLNLDLEDVRDLEDGFDVDLNERKGKDVRKFRIGRDDNDRQRGKERARLAKVNRARKSAFLDSEHDE